MKKKVRRICLRTIYIILIGAILITIYEINILKNKQIKKEENIIDILEMQENDNRLDIMEINIEEEIENNITVNDKNTEIGKATEIHNIDTQTIEQEETRTIEPHIDSTTNTKYITYEDIGKAENGEDSYHIIKETHEIANKNNYEVRATLNEYHIYRLNEIEPIYIQTSTNWNGANFIIHDEEIKNDTSKKYEIFQIASTQKEITITDSKLLNDISLNRQTKKIEQIKGYGDCLCIVYNSNKKQFIRSGSNQNQGEIQQDLFKIDNDGTLLNDIKWDFEEITMIRLIPIPKEQIIIQNGNFQTNLDKEQYEQESGYWSRNIRCLRSNTMFKNINHTLDNENNLGGPYFGFLRISYATEVEVQKCRLVAHKYEKVSNYDLILEYATNILLDEVVCDKIEENDRWGITGTNYTKDITYKNCILNRIDAHCGVHNLTIDNCLVGTKGLTLNGTGELKIFNSTRIGGNSFIELRADYGSTWDGNIQIQNCKYHNTNKSNRLIGFKVTYNQEGNLHNYGYEIVLPNIYINDLKIEDDNTKDEPIYVFYNDKYNTKNEEGNLVQAGYTLLKEIKIDNYEVSYGKAIKAFYQDFEELSGVNIKINIPNRPKLKMQDENENEYISGNLTNQNIYLNLETKEKITNELKINGQVIKEKRTILKQTGDYQVIVTSVDNVGNSIKDEYQIKIDKEAPIIEGIEEDKTYEYGVTPIIKDENLDSVTLYYNENVVQDYEINSQLTREGIYRIEATDKAGNKKSIKFEIQNPEKLENIKCYKVKEKYITEILPTTTRESFFENAMLNSKLKIYHEGKEITDVEIIKTGDILKVNNLDYTLIVKADPSGDGKTSIIDLMKVKRHIIGVDYLNEAATLASDLNEDGKVNIMDAMNFVRLLTQ